MVTEFQRCYPETARSNTSFFANKLQAISIPLAMLGRIEQATKFVAEAKAIAEIMPEETIFSVFSYREEPPNVFVAHCAEMLGALKNNRLWDGTPLSAQSEVSS